ncbi:Amnionless-like protein [Sarcoptes scabiei]|uniref:Protein amnionless n=1 Tax=Sarcoptes scabiei TaxID=52283 RepID=A0A132A2N4_SARSC|nr:Amnionless-like protein [Sarcoptes scabiei]
MPENGLIVIDNDAGAIEFSTNENNLDFEDFNDIECKSNETFYFDPKIDNLNSWFNPNNWHQAFALDSFVESKISTYAPISSFATFHRQRMFEEKQSSFALIPDSELIPCHRDYVDLPINGSWKIRIGNNSRLIPMLANLKIGATNFGTLTFQSFVSSFIGKMLFEIEEYNHIEINTPSERCRKAKCACGNDRMLVMEEICRFKENKCPTLQCHDPIKPSGFCCQICASSLVIQNNFENDDSLWKTYLRLIEHINDLNEEKKFKISRLFLYAHWLFNGSIQILVSNAPTLKKSSETNPLLVSNEFVQKLKDKLSNDSDLMLTEMIIFSSIKWMNDTNFFDSKILLIGILIFLFTSVSVICYHHLKRKRNGPDFTFVRFRSINNGVELELDNPERIYDFILPKQTSIESSNRNQSS